MKRCSLLLALFSVYSFAPTASAGDSTHRLYDGITAFVNNPDGREFTVTLDVRDINHRMHGPSELFVKVYPPDGKPVVRELIPDDGVLTHTSNPSAAGWDHEAWYYATCYSRGLQPLVRWSAFSAPDRLATLETRRFTYKVAGGQKGVYRVLVVGAPDHYVTLGIDSDLKYGVSGSPEWIHGHGEMFRRSYVFVPKTTHAINLLFLQFDEPATRTFLLKDLKGNVLAEGDGAEGLVQTSVEALGKFDDQILMLDVSGGSGDFLLNVTFQLDNEFKPVRAPYQAVTAVLSPDEETARATRGGAIYHDGRVFWQMTQVRLHDWLKQIADEDFVYRRGDHKLLSTLWSHHLVERPENQLTGVGFLWGGYHRSHGQFMDGPASFKVHRPDHWLFGGTDLKRDDRFGGKDTIVGYECDGCEMTWNDGLPFPTHKDGTPESFRILATCPARWAPGDSYWYDRFPKDRTGAAVLGVYTRGGTVVTTGTTDWAHGLRGEDPTVMRITRNILDRLSTPRETEPK